MSNQNWTPPSNPDPAEGGQPAYDPPNYTPPPAPGGYQPPAPGGYQPPAPGGYQPPAPGGYQPPAAASPYEPQPPAGPYGQPPVGGYGQPPASPYGQPPVGNYAQPPAYPTPYGQPMDPTGAGYAAGPRLVEWPKRALSYLIDMGPVIVLNMISNGLFGARIDATTGAMVGGNGLLSTLLSLVGLAWVVYNSGYLQGTTGQSYGRKYTKTRLVSEATGQPVGFGMAVLRQLAHFVDAIICFVGYLFPLWDAKKQTIADKIMKTLVIED